MASVSAKRGVEIQLAVIGVVSLGYLAEEARFIETVSLERHRERLQASCGLLRRVVQQSGGVETAASPNARGERPK